MSVTLTPLQQSDREQFILDNQESFVERVNRLSLFFSFFASHLNLGDGVRGSIWGEEGLIGLKDLLARI